jgi:hypothetical protein
MGQGSDFARSYNSFSGVDIKGVFGTTVVAELQAISYSVTREKAPIYTMGEADPRSFSRGKRGIAGTLIFIVFDRHALLGSMGVFAPTNQQRKFQSDTDSLRPKLTQTATGGVVGKALRGETLTAPSGNSPGNVVQQQESALEDTIFSDQEVAVPWFADQLPPFDITLAAANEYGALAVMRIYGAEILNEGSGVSIDDVVTETQSTYIARSLIPWSPISNTDVIDQIATAGVTQ